jgi:hypothetical protein
MMSSKMFLLFRKQIKIQWHQPGTIWCVTEDSETKVSYLCSCSHTCVRLSIVFSGERLLHVRTNSSKSSFQILWCFSILLRVNVVKVSMNSEWIMLKHPKNLWTWLCQQMLQSDVYTICSIHNFHLLKNTNHRQVFCSQELLSLQTVSSIPTYVNYATFMTTIQSPLAAEV